MRKIFLLGFALIMSGCIATHDHRGRMIDAENFAKLKVKVDNKDVVQQTIGSPTFIDKFNPHQWVYVYQYTSRRSFYHPDTVELRIVRANFDKNGVLQSLDRHQAKSIPEVSPVARVTETSGHRNTFAQQLFGNFGKYRQKK